MVIYASFQSTLFFFDIYCVSSRSLFLVDLRIYLVTGGGTFLSCSLFCDLFHKRYERDKRYFKILNLGNRL